MSRRILGVLEKHQYRPYTAGSHFFLSAILASLTLLVSSVSAQQEQQSQQEGSSGADGAATDQSQTADEEKTDQNALPNSQLGTSNDRLFKLLPNFLTLEDAKQHPPLTTGEKFKV